MFSTLCQHECRLGCVANTRDVIGHGDIGVYLFDGIAALMAYSAECELPFRVGVAFGECFIDQETNRYLGQPIIDAYLVEQNQQWFGGACHPNCDEAPFIQAVEKNALILPYEVPVKMEDLSLHKAIEWISWTNPNFDEFLKDKLSTIEKQDVHLKYKNALNFYYVVRPPENIFRS